MLIFPAKYKITIGTAVLTDITAMHIKIPPINNPLSLSGNIFRTAFSHSDINFPIKTTG